jgi:TRAP-type transport system periplasmic protein
MTSDSARTRRPPWWVAGFILAAVSLIAAACGDGTQNGDVAGDDDASNETSEPSAEGDTYHFDLSSILGPTNANNVTLQRWAERVEELTDGRATFTFHDLGSLVGGGDNLAAVRDGRTDIGHDTVAFYPAELPLAQVESLPFVSTNSHAQMMALNDLYQQDGSLRDEYQDQGLHVLTYIGLGPAVIGAADPIDSIDDLNGRSARAIGYLQQAFDLVDANPVPVPTLEIYESLEHGLIEVWSSVPLQGALDINLQDHGPIVRDPGTGNYTTIVAFMSLDAWEQLPSDIQDAMDEAREWIEENFYDIQVEAITPICDQAIEDGVELEVWPEEEQERWREIAEEPIVEDWVESTEDVAPEAREFLEEYRSLMADYEQQSDWVSENEWCAERIADAR